MYLYYVWSFINVNKMYHCALLQVLFNCIQDRYVYGCPSFWLGLFLVPCVVLLSDIAIKT